MTTLSSDQQMKLQRASELISTGVVLVVVRSVEKPPWADLRNRLNHDNTQHLAKVSAHAGPVSVNAAPTSVRVASPDFISTPVPACVACVVVDASNVIEPTFMNA